VLGVELAPTMLVSLLALSNPAVRVADPGKVVVVRSPSVL
jgi:hypothetical protein